MFSDNTKGLFFTGTVAVGIAGAAAVLKKYALHTPTPTADLYLVFEKKINADFTIICHLCVDSEATALQALQNFETIIKDKPLAEVINCFVKYDFFYTEPKVGSDPIIKLGPNSIFEVALPMYKTVLQNEFPDEFVKFEVANQYNLGSGEMNFIIHDNSLGIKFDSDSFKVTDILPQAFAAYSDKLHTKHFGTNPNLAEVIQQYSAAVEYFITNHNSHSDPVKFTLDREKTDQRLKNIFTGEVDYVPVLYEHYYKFTTFSKQFYAAIIDTFEATRSKLDSDLKNYQPIKLAADGEHGITPLMIVAARLCLPYYTPDRVSKESLHLADRLIAQQADVNARDIWGRTALMYVALARFIFDVHGIPGRGLMTQKLLEAGADPTITDHLGHDALFYHQHDGLEPHVGIKLIEESIAQRQNSRQQHRVICS